MIIDNSVNYNNYEELIFKFYGFFKYICPSCSAKNCFIRHATYPRNICLLVSDEFVYEKTTILRLLCKSCNATHAILPAGTIPYWCFSYDCVLKVLTTVLIHKKSVPKVSEKYKISVQIIYLFLLKHSQCKISCINFLNFYLKISLEYSAPAHEPLIIIGNNFTDAVFLEKYFYHTKQIFLMMRKENILSKKIKIDMIFLDI